MSTASDRLARHITSQEGAVAFQVVLVSPQGYVHSAALAEVIETVACGLRGLGFEVTEAVNRLVVPGPRPILFGAHLLSGGDAGLLPAGTIVYNLEQLSESSSWCSPAYLQLLKRCEVWDYSSRNLAALARLGATSRPKHVPVGYVPEMTRIAPKVSEDIDVLFYGSMNERRAKVIGGLRQVGLAAEAVFGVYGAERDAVDLTVQGRLEPALLRHSDIRAGPRELSPGQPQGSSR